MTYFPTKDNLDHFNLLFCPVLEKWVGEDTCIWCNCTRYPGGDFRCNVWHDRGNVFPSNKGRPGNVCSWTTDEIIKLMQAEETRVKEINKKAGYERQVHPKSTRGNSDGP